MIAYFNAKWYRKYSQSGYRKAIIYAMVFYTALPLCTVLANAFSLKWCKMDVQNFLMFRHVISHSLFSSILVVYSLTYVVCSHSIKIQVTSRIIP